MWHLQTVLGHCCMSTSVELKPQIRERVKNQPRLKACKMKLIKRHLKHHVKEILEM